MDSVIAIIDDDRAVREALQRMLQSYGFATRVFASAEDFLAAGQEGVACLILDVRMPGLSGLALHRQLTSDGAGIPAIIITARPTDGERDQAMAEGAISYLAKPLGEQVLLSAVREALDDGGAASAGLPAAGAMRGCR